MIIIKEKQSRDQIPSISVPSEMVAVITKRTYYPLTLPSLRGPSHLFQVSCLG